MVQKSQKKPHSTNMKLSARGVCQVAYQAQSNENAKCILQIQNGILLHLLDVWHALRSEWPFIIIIMAA